MNPENLTIGLALIAGLISFISPCVLPLVPAYISYMGGRVANTISAQLNAGGQAVLRPTTSARFATVLHSLAFVGGFTFVFVVIGLFSTALIQQIGGQNINLVTGMIGRIGGVVVIFLGLHFMGVLPSVFNWLQARPHLLSSPLTTPLIALAGAALILWGFTGVLLPALNTTLTTTAGTVTTLHWPTLIALAALTGFLLWIILGGALIAPGRFWSSTIQTVQTALYTDTRRQMTARGQQGLSGSAIMGVVFAAGWTPCIGPVYGAVLTLAANTGDVVRAAPLLAAYSLGLGIPFVLTAALLDSAQNLLRRLQRHMRKIELASGAFLVLIGLLVATGTLQSLSAYLSGQYAEVAISVEERVINALTGQDAAPTMAPEGDASLNTITSVAALSAAEGLEVGQIAPDFVSVTDSGDPIKLSDLRGQVVLLNFWASWCGPCRLEMPEFQAAYARYGDQGFSVVAVNYGEAAETVQNFRKGLKLTFPLVMDERGEVQTRYGINQYPTSLLIGRDGVILARFFGAMTAEQIAQAVDSALAS